MSGFRIRSEHHAGAEPSKPAKVRLVEQRLGNVSGAEQGTRSKAKYQEQRWAQEPGVRLDIRSAWQDLLVAVRQGSTNYTDALQLFPLGLK